MEQKWYVMHVRRGSQPQVAAYLEGKGIEAYLPVIKRPGRARGSVTTVPLFPGYFFVRLDLQLEEWLIARSAPGVQYLLGGRGAPTPVADEILGAIRERVEAELSRGVAVPFRAGERVRLTEGSLRDVEAVFDRTLNASGRVRVLIRMVGREVPAEVPVDALKRTG